MHILRSLYHKNFRIHLFGQSISLIGSWMQRVAMSWLVFTMTDSAMMLGIVSFVSLIPSLVLSPFIGSFIDKHNKFLTLIAAQTGLMIQAGILATLVWFHWHTIPLILTLSLIQGIFNALEVNSRQSFMMELVEDKQDLPNAIALNSTVFNLARIVGPAIGGIILSTMGEAWCFLINFLSFFAVMTSMKLIKVNKSRTVGTSESTWQGFKEGYNYLKAHPHLRALIFLIGASSLFVIPYTTLLPVIAKSMFQGGAQTYSWLESAAGIGAMLGAIYMANLQGGTNLRFRVMIGSGLMAVGLLVLPFVSNVYMALVCVTLAALGMMVQNSCINTYLQTHTQSAYRARIISYYIMAFQGIFPIGSLIIGSFAEKLGVQYVLIIQGCIGLMISIGYISHIFRRLRQH